MRLYPGLKVFVKKHGATILTCAGTVGVVATSVMAGKATIKAIDILKEHQDEELSIVDKMIVTLPAYIPTILMGTATISCILGANLLNKRHQASLLSAYAMLNSSYKEYKNKVTDLYGEEADEKIQEEIVKDHADTDNEVTLFYDVRSDRFFESTLFKVQQAEYFLNRELIMKDYAYLNEWYELLDLDIVENGYALGWTTCACLEMYWQPWLDFDHSRKTTEDGREYIAISFWEEPIPDFEDYC